ncbi:MAG TPA: amidohydrolase family protein [Candidatus Eremiobacteraceae bacterium]|nr:amidohydrolase family protein [Candidatus Eremiobacteraceae bacterium]
MHATSATTVEPAPRFELTFFLRQFLLPAAFLVGTPFPLYLLVQFKTGDALDVVLLVLVWLVALVCYWLPVGALLFAWRGGWLSRFVVGYLVSIPCYYLTVFLGLRLLTLSFLPQSLAFHGSKWEQWVAFSYATPTFYLMVLVFYLLVRQGRRLARVFQALAVAGLCLSVISTAVLAARVDSYRWPAVSSARVDIVNSKIVDTAEGRLIEGQDVLVENGKIARIVGASADTSSWSKVDARGGYLVPGLIDVHVHFQSVSRSILSAQRGFDFPYFLDAMLEQYAPERREFLEKGITAIRCLGGPAESMYEIRGEVAQHRLLGPRIFAAGRLVTSPEGHPASTIWPREITRQGAILASTPENLIAGLEENYREGPPDAVKFIYGTIGLAHESISKELLDRGIAWASSKHLASVVHVETAQEASEAVEAGATGIEHVATLEQMPEELVAAMVAHHTFADPTFGEYKTALTLRNVSPSEIAARMPEKYAFIRRLDAAGVPLTIGTDAPLVEFGNGYDDELEEFARAGFGAAQILKFATINNAAYLGKAGELGRIADGYDAAMLLVRENPLADVGALRKPEWVMIDGQIVTGKAGR